jgi:hypothetical protein
LWWCLLWLSLLVPHHCVVYNQDLALISYREMRHLLFVAIATLIYAKPTVPTENDSQSNIPLTKYSVPLIAAFNSHHIYIYVGSPPQRRLVIADTGSRFLVFPCKPCTKCGNKHFSKEYFDPSYSTTDINNQCSARECFFSVKDSCNNSDECSWRSAFTEGSSVRGFEVEDLVWIGTDNLEESIKVHMQAAVPFSFGCSTSETGLIANQYADGIIGMASLQKDTVVDVMYREGTIPHRAFALCLTADGGVLSLGGTAVSHRHKEQMTSQPLTSSSFYTIEVVAFIVGDIELKGYTDRFISDAFNAGKGTVVDSGTTDTYIPKQVAPQFIRAWEKITKTKYHNEATRLTWRNFQKFPNVTIVLASGYKWVIEPHSYLEQAHLKESPLVDTRSAWDGRITFRNRLYVDEPEGAVLGSNAMIGHDILFDLEGQTLGIAGANCTR